AARRARHRAVAAAGHVRLHGRDDRRRDLDAAGRPRQHRGDDDRPAAGAWRRLRARPGRHHGDPPHHLVVRHRPRLAGAALRAAAGPPSPRVAGRRGDGAPMRWQKRTLTGWGRSSHAAVAACRPERVAEIQRALRDVGSEGIIAFAGGRSYGDAALNEGGRVLLTERLDRLLSFDPESGELAAQPRVTFPALLHTFLPRGFIVPVTPGTAYATLGGAVAMDVHGKNHDWAGSFGDHLLWIDLLLPSGEVVRTSPESRPGLFAATIGGLGLTGIIVGLALRLMRTPSPAGSVRQLRTAGLDETMALIRQHRDSATFSVSWVDTLARGRRLGRGIVEIAEPAREGAEAPLPGRRRRVPADLPGWLLNRLSVAAFNQFYWRHVPREGRTR